MSDPASLAPAAEAADPGSGGASAAWPDDVHALLASLGVTQVAMVPDAGHARLISLCEADSRMKVVRLTSEQEGVSLLTGAWLGGAKGVLLMQSSGVGNCINMLSLPAVLRIPVLMLVTMRGDWGEFNPMQVAMGQATQTALEAMGVIVQRADRAEEVVETVSGAARIAFNSSAPVAVLIGQKVLGAKDFKGLAKT